MNIVYVANILVSSSVIAFNLHTYEYLFTFEYAVDWIVFTDMIVYFFTAFPSKEGVDSDELIYNKSLKDIAKNYLSQYFFTDFVGVVPCLAVETYFCFVLGWTPRLLASHAWFKYLYFTKLLRFSQIPRLGE